MIANVDLPGTPIGAPRMTRADAWKRRPRVLLYRAWRDAARVALLAAGAPMDKCPLRIDAVAYFPMPKSWSPVKRHRLFLQPHTSKPDWDNVGKAIGDLWKSDAGIAQGSVKKLWIMPEDRGCIELVLTY